MSDLPRIVLNIPASAEISFSLSHKYTWQVLNENNEDGSSRISVIATSETDTVMIGEQPDVVVDLRVDEPPARVLSEEPVFKELCERMQNAMDLGSSPDRTECTCTCITEK